MTANSNDSQVRVAVRIRPLTSRENSVGGKVVVDGNAFERTVSLSKRKFTYDSVFHPNVTQLELYSSVAPPLLDAFLGGYNATVIAYGQTGSGKTYTMGSEAGGSFEENSGNLSDNVGLIPRFTSDLFASLVQRREASEKALLRNWDVENAPKQCVSLIDFRVSASFLEVYGEDIYDLLDDDRNALKIREGSNKEVCVKGLKSVPINNSSEAMDVLNTGTMNRTTASTLMNVTSSRSHACFTVNLHQTTRSADGDELTTTSRFTFVDLAGSERMKKTGAEGDRAKEGIKINEGLLALGNVINALADEERLATGGRVHVPYRQSKLTRLLQDALGGNSQTLFLACVSPSDTNASETLSTLHYANRARNIKNTPTRGVDAAAEELRRLRTLTNLLKSELIKHRFTAAEPEVERSNENSDHPQDIGVLNEGLLQRDDVISYMKMIDEMASQLSGSNSLSSSDQTMQQSFLVTPPRRQLMSEESSTFERSDLDVEGNDNSDGSDLYLNTDEDMGIADELLLETQHEDQISKIEGDIEEQEERLLQLKERFIQYHDMKERYQMLSNEVQKLEAEKQELIEKLEKAQSGEGSSWIKSKLEQVKASLVQARLDVRKQQQKCRDAELDAQRCKGLERRIEEMKNIKVNLIKKHQDDAKRQKDFSKTKAREIQDARKREIIARKMVLKLEAENTRLKSNLENSRSRNNNLSKKLKETELNLKQALSTRRKSKASSHIETVIFAPSNARTDSIKHVLDKTVSDRVALAQNRLIYKSKVALRESLFHSMTTEVKTLNVLKRECEAMENEPSNERLADIKDREDNVQEFLIQMELVEKNIEELQAKYPRIEDETMDNTFDEHEPALRMISKLNSPDLRALLLLFLSSSYSSELDRKGMRDALVTKDSILKTLEDEIAAQSDKIGILAKSLGRHHSELDARNAKLHSGMVDMDGVLLELEKTKSLLSVSEEKHKNADEKLSQAITQTTEQLSISHGQELEKLRNELVSSYSKEIQRVHELADEQRLAEVSRVKNELMNIHATEIEKVVSDKEVQVRSEMNASASQLLSTQRNELALVREELKNSEKDNSVQRAAGMVLRTEGRRGVGDYGDDFDGVGADEKRGGGNLGDGRRGGIAVDGDGDAVDPTDFYRYLSSNANAENKAINTNNVGDAAMVFRSLISLLERSVCDELGRLSSSETKIRASLERVQSSMQESLVREFEQAKEARSISEETLKEAETQMAEIPSKQMQTDSIEEEIPERHESAPQDEVYGAHSLAIDTSCGETPPSSECTPTSARSSSSSVIPTFAKFDSLKQRYLKKLRESPRSAASASFPKWQPVSNEK